MGNSSCSQALQDEDLERIESETGFTANQIDRLYSRFSRLDKEGKGFLSREDFLRIPELAINPLGDRIVHGFFYESKEGDADQINFSDFVRVLSHFRPIDEKTDIETEEDLTPNSRLEKLHFAFRMYDLDNDNMISRDELLSVLSMMVGSNISSDQLESIAQRTIQDADVDKDGLISFEEFVNALEKSDVEQKMSIKFLS